jgi:hypothetical protein
MEQALAQLQHTYHTLLRSYDTVLLDLDLEEEEEAEEMGVTLEAWFASHIESPSAFRRRRPFLVNIFIITIPIIVVVIIIIIIVMNLQTCILIGGPVDSTIARRRERCLQASAGVDTSVWARPCHTYAS